jgi:hypothetical protein
MSSRKRRMEREITKGETVDAQTLEQNEGYKPILREKSRLTSPNSRYSFDKINPGIPEAGFFEA